VKEPSKFLPRMLCISAAIDVTQCLCVRLSR